MPTPLPHLCHSQSPIPRVLSVVLFLWLDWWSRHIWYTFLLNNNMDLNMFSLGTSAPEGPWCVFYSQRCQVYWGLTYNVVFYWYSDLISDTNTCSTLRDSRLTLPYECIFTILVMCSQQLLLLHYMIKWIIHWYQKFTFHNVFSFQKLFTCKRDPNKREVQLCFSFFKLRK